MKLLKVITILTSLLIATPAVAGNTPSDEINGSLIEMPAPIFFGDDLKYSMPAFLWRQTQFLRFRLKKEEKKNAQVSSIFYVRKCRER